METKESRINDLTWELLEKLGFKMEKDKTHDLEEELILILNRTKNEKWQDKFLQAGTKELGIDCSVLIKTVSEIIEEEK